MRFQQENLFAWSWKRTLIIQASSDVIRKCEETEINIRSAMFSTIYVGSLWVIEPWEFGDYCLVQVHVNLLLFAMAILVLLIYHQQKDKVQKTVTLPCVHCFIWSPYEPAGSIYPNLLWEAFITLSFATLMKRHCISSSVTLGHIIAFQAQKIQDDSPGA